MSFSDLFGTSEHSRNLSHFAAIVSLAAIDGEINEREEALLKKFAWKLDVTEEEYSIVMNNSLAFPINSYHSVEKRLERLHDLFRIIFADHEIDKEERDLVRRYAIGLGFSSGAADQIIERSIRIFSGQISFEEYCDLLKKVE